MTEIEKKFADAVIFNKIEIVKECIKAGVDINIKFGDDNTAVIFACLYGFVELLEILIENGADINIKSFYGYTALEYAKHKNKTKIVKLLEDA